MSVDPQKTKRRHRSEEPHHEPHPPIQARVTYLLSEQGRRELLRRGGDGRMRQEVECIVSDADLDVFAVDEGGAVALNLAQPFEDIIGEPPFEALPKKFHWEEIAPDSGLSLQWDVVPTSEDFIAVARRYKAYNDSFAEYAEENEKRVKEIARQFFADSKARATTIERNYVVIGGQRFESLTAVGIEARRRWTADQEKLKEANRVTLGSWIEQYGTDNQRQRLAVGLLPWKEAYDAVEASLFAPLQAFLPYERFEIPDICICSETHCNPKFQSVDATELNADEWEQFTRIGAAAPGAQFQLREHRAHCESAAEPSVKRGVIVKFALDNLTFKREFAL